MEAAPRLPMLSFDLKVNTEVTQFAPQLRQYIAAFYNEDPDSYLAEIHNLESLRAVAVRPSMDVNGVLLLKKYYCQLHFLKSRFPMEENQDASVQFSWRDNQLDVNYSSTDVRFELMVIMYNIGALHSYLGANESRNNPDGMKLACTHFQCSAWAFQCVKEKYHQFVVCISLVQLVHFFQQVCLAQAQECILEKSMLDNRKATIVAKVAVQVYNYYRQSLGILESTSEDLGRDRMYKEWTKYLQFKIAYYKCVSFLFQGQQAEEQQKMGERVAFYQAASEQLEEAKKWSNALKTKQQELNEGLAFTQDVVEGKRKAAKNENEFIYHEEVPDKDHLEEVKGASLVKGIPFSINDTEISGPDIFARLVPMEAHEAASLYSEKKAQLLRQICELIENKDQALAEFMSSMQLDMLTKMHQATGIPQELIDRAASLSARPAATQDLVDAMGKLSNIYQDVESNLNEIDVLLKEEEEAEKGYQELMGKRPPSIIATDLAREAAKYKEAHSKANESNQTLHRAMMAHVANLKIMQQPLRQLQQQLPAVELPNSNIDEKVLKDLETLVAKVEEMRNQRAMLWAQLRESVHKDDITNSLVTKQPNQSLDQLFQQELEKHKQLTGLIEQNAAAQENIKKALVDTYAQAVSTRRYIQDIIQKRSSTIAALIASHDSYEDLLSKANKGIEFYTKLETNVSKLLQRIKSACKVQQEEREQILLKNEITAKTDNVVTPAAPKLKDYLDSRKRNPVATYPDSTLQYTQQAGNYTSMDLPPGIRPAPLGSEITDAPKSTGIEPYTYPANMQYNYGQTPSNKTQYLYQQPTITPVEDELSSRMKSLYSNSKSDITAQQYNPQYSYSSYIPQNYTPTQYSYTTQANDILPSHITSNYDPNKAYTTTTNSYRPLSSYTVPNNTNTHMQYPDSSLGTINENASSGTYQYPNYSSTGYTQPTLSVSQSTPVNVNTYYPSGYAPNYTTNQSNIEHFPGQLQYHSLQYATSVQADQQNYNHNSTYSSPVVSIENAQIKDSSYVATGYYPPVAAVPSGTETSHIQTTTGVGYSPNIPQHPHSTGSNSNLIPSSASTHNLTENYQYYNKDQTYPIASMNQSYPTGSISYMVTVPAYTSTSTIYTNGTQFTPQTYAGASYYPETPSKMSVTPNQTYNSGTTNTQQVATGTQGNYNQYYEQNYSTPVQSYTSTYQYNTSAQATPSATPVTTKESNIDLLSGLDFTINQTPLVPQKNMPKTEECEIKPVASGNTVVNTKAATIIKEESPVIEIKKPIMKILPSKPLNNTDVKNLFTQEIERYEKYIETLTNKTLSGPTNLDIKWKEIQEKQDCDGQKKIISVARCYPMKNRFPDILPYDFSRVEISGTKDDYINASFIKDVSPYAPLFIVTQAPLSTTVGEFWIMIKEQQVELIFCLMNDTEIGEDIYWPKEKGQNLSILNMVISLQSVIVKSHWVERLISINIPEKRESYVVMHLQFTSWPGSLFPTSSEPFISYVLEALNLYQQQRCNSHPVIVHCHSGIGRTGLFCLLTAAILDVTNNANSLPDLATLTMKLTNCQKNILRDREHLKFAYECFLSYMKQVVSVDKTKRKLNEIIPKGQDDVKHLDVVEQNPDPLSKLDAFWASKK